MNEDLMLNYVLLSHGEYQGAIKALQVIDQISNALDRAPEQAIPNLIRIILGKETIDDTGEVTEHSEGTESAEVSA